MRYTLKKGDLEAVIDDCGCELVSLLKKDQELMWSRDPAYWDSSSLILFPFIGRNFEDCYRYNRTIYHIPLHGFAMRKRFTLIEKDAEQACFSLTQDEETLSHYPFSFELQIRYRLTDESLEAVFTVRNDSDRTMIYDLGYHPGFALHSKLEDHRIYFPHAADCQEIDIVKKCMLNGNTEEIRLADGRLSLNRDLFKNSARVYKGMGDTAILEDLGGKQLLQISYDGFDHLTLWQTLDSDAAFLCIEGWSGLPGRYGVIEDIEEGSSRHRLDPGKTDGFAVRITI